MKGLIVVFVLGGILFIGSSCAKQETFSEYDSEKRALNLQDSFDYDHKESKVFTQNELLADVKLSGIDTVWELDCSTSDFLDINYHSENKSGEFKVILVKPNHKVETLFENTDKGTKKKKMPAGKNYIRIIGNQSDATFGIKYQVGKQTKIIMNQVKDNYQAQN